jgi:hypothetical protein
LITGTPTTAGSYTVHLTATNANGTGTKDVTFTINSGPTALATISPTAVYAGDIVTLDASASHTNPPGGTLIYTWQQIAPATPTISLSPDNKSVIATFAAPAPPVGADSQAVTFQVKVTDNSVSGGAKNSQSPDVTTTVYALPTANAGSDAHATEGTQVQLHGSGTGVNLSYTWTAPTGSGITFLDTLTDTSHVQNPKFIAPPVSHNGAAYTFTLKVTEDRGIAGLPTKDSADQVTINVDDLNSVPTAYASAVNDPNNLQPEGTVDESTNVTIYGFGIDPDIYDNPITQFKWTQVHDTMGNPLTGDDPVVTLLPNSSSQAPSFTAPPVANGLQQIDLVFCLTVSDGFSPSGPSYVTIHVLNTNDPPIPALTVNGSTDDPVQVGEGTSVTLDGITSTDINNDTLSYKWEQIAGTAVALNPPTGFSSNSMATFTAPLLETTLTFRLTVSDGDFEVSKEASVKVVQTNHPPFADAGQPQTVPEGATAFLDGSNSYDPDSDDLSFQWTQTAGPAVSNLVGDATSSPSFVAPKFGGLGGSVTFKLIVTDTHGASSAPSYVVVSVFPNRPPIPNAGDDQTIDERTGVANLNGSATDADHNDLTLLWEQVSGPPVTLTYEDPNDASKATFIAPEVLCGGEAVLMKLTVNDGYVDAFDYVTINIKNVNRLPTADAGVDQNVKEGDPVTLNGSNSNDQDQDATLGFSWTQTGGPTVALSNASAAAPSFTAPAIGGGDPNAKVDLAFHLLVTDGCGGSAQTDTTVHVANIPHDPIASATGPATANEGGSTVMLDGSGSSDPDNDPLTYVWTQTAGPAVTLNNPGSAMPSFSTPWVTADTPLTFKLTVSDPYGGSSYASVTVTVMNINTPPTLVNPRADVPVLWPPDHRLVPVHILGVVDPDQPPYNATITITGVTQDEPTNGLGDGDTPVDAIIHGDTVLLRAERSGKGDGRVYHVCFTAADPEGSVSGCVDVIVPHDKRTDPAKNSGQNYNSTK